MATKETVLEGCEIICIGNAIPPTDLIACPLPKSAQDLCKQRQQYQAGQRKVIDWLHGDCGCKIHPVFRRISNLRIDCWKCRGKLKERKND